MRTSALRRAELRVLPRRPRAAKVFGTVVLGAVVSATLGIASLVEGETVVSVLEPTSPTGCVVVVEESRGLMSVSGRIGTLAAGGAVPRWQGTFGSDDGFRPFADGTSEVRWADESATVRLLAPARPAGPTAWDVVC